MALSHTTKTDLRRELADLEQMRDAMEARITAIEAVLAGESATYPVQATATVNHEREAVAKPTVSPRATRKRRGGERLATTISAIIHRTPGLRSGQVTQMLKDDGVPLRGKTPLRKRVYAELRRLVKRGLIRKESAGGYVPATTDHAEVDARLGIG
jgi:hypothetical protein